MKIVLETDIGRDPDDLIALLYLIHKGLAPNVVCITPGDTDQIAIADFVRTYFGLNFHIKIPKGNREKRIGKSSSGGTHYKLLKMYGADLSCQDDGEITINDMCRVLSIGPMTNLRELFGGKEHLMADVVIQGGFCPYSIATPSIKLEKFVGKESMPTFNFNGDHSAADWMFNTTAFKRYVGKNVCHAFEFTKEDLWLYDLQSRAGFLLLDFLQLYFAKHASKKMHDLLAAMIFRNPTHAMYSITQEYYADFIQATPDRVSNNEYTTKYDYTNYNSVLTNIDFEYAKYAFLKDL